MSLLSTVTNGDTAQDLWNAIATLQSNGAPVPTIKAAGSTLLAATPVVGRKTLVTVTASTEGVSLPAPSTGAEYVILVPGTVGVKVYPGPAKALGYVLDAGATSAAAVLAAGKVNRYHGVSLLKWVTEKGA